MLFNINNVYKRVKASSLFRSSGVYTISNFINASIPLLLLPVLTEILSPADYGIIAMFQIVVGVIYPFIGMNLEGAITRKYYDKDYDNFPSYIGTCLILIMISFALVTAVFAGFHGFIQEFTQIPELWLKYILIVAVSQIMISINLAVFQVKVQPIKYGTLQISQSLLNLVLTIILVLVYDRNWEGRLEAQISTYFVIAVISLITLYGSKQIKLNIKKSDILDALKFGIPLIPHFIGGMLFLSIDRFFLTKLVGLDQTGNFTVAYQIGTVVFLITSAFNVAFVPWLYENLNKNDLKIKYKIVKFTYLYFGISTIGAIILIGIFPILISIFVRGSFNSVDIYSVFIVFGFVFQGMYFMVTNYIAYAKKTHIQAIITLAVGLLKLPIAYFSIIWFGAVGASISFCLTFFLFFIVTWIYSNRVYSMPWNILTKKKLIVK